MVLQLKRANALMHSQQKASIAPIVIGCIDYLAYGNIFTRAMCRPKKLDDFFSAKKAVDACREVVSLTPKCIPAGTNTPSSPVCYVGIVRLSYMSHISHPMKTTTMVKPLPPPLAWV